ncbi:lipopolysaccharide heptosyltransferase II [Aromatoleum aromaticum]|uniref:lipopolysaccharide heptosyltransferase II n=1 Tax=Aromatoleum aromaticum (strain DSM 19018 / LMG 30748 / EbN1) TaxID=76114 RepID=Q5NXZ9_AROAE|nr:lipopolysaccharide heptosyltransferase II [Aromatoleum aromaticum]NMG55164.1 lipopolysaccharide heptosyltransferase II [Aromatoleum aromaticum]CAI10065.1 ADP-heptose--LPS heptosyltransferase II [Aromatoleum aromaticum EbN1]
MDALTRAARWKEAGRILAVRLDNLGDVLMTTPALRALRESVPGRHITLLTSASGAAAVPFVPEVDAAIVASGAPWMPGVDSPPDRLIETAQLLRERRFDAAVIFTVYSQSALPAAMLCWLAGIPLRLAHCRENPYQLLTDWIEDPEPQELLRHEVRRQLDLVAAVGASCDDRRLSFRLRDEDKAHARALLRGEGIDPERPYVVIHPGASAPSRRYPEEHFAAVVKRVLGFAAGGQVFRVLFTGDESERALVDTIRSLAGNCLPSLAGRLSLGELAAVIDSAAVLIANNTGPVHLAAAVGTPVVDIYALTNPQHAPWKVAHRVLYEDVPCRFCYRSVCPQGHHNCLRLLDPQRVAEAARELLELGAEQSSVPLPAISAGKHDLF